MCWDIRYYVVAVGHFGQSQAHKTVLLSRVYVNILKAVLDPEHMHERDL